MYRAVALDVCGVLTTHKSVWQFIHEELGLWTNNAEYFQDDFLAGRISYREFCDRDARLWAGIDTGEMERIIDRLPLRKDIDELFSFLTDHSLRVGLISTGLTLLTDRFSRRYPVDFSIANHLLWENGRLTGDVEIRVEHDGKGAALGRFARSVGIRLSEIIAVGDGESDIPMFRAAGMGVGFASGGSVSEKMKRAADVLVTADVAALTAALNNLL
ncbi:MAG: HAD-IB family phosphatase [Deltaproteobacteria bacterium]|nr:HAD-IB family phosphatase [Candidatus Zymogenaceae bacterium]